MKTWKKQCDNVFAELEAANIKFLLWCCRCKTGVETHRFKPTDFQADARK